MCGAPARGEHHPQKEIPLKTASRLILVLTLSLAFSSSAQARGFFRVVDLSDAENVPGFISPTDAQGRFLIRTTFRGGLRYSLDVSSLPNAFAAHIHCGAAGVAAPIGVTLFQNVNPFDGTIAPVTVNGTIAHGPISAPDPGNACGWADLDDVVEALRSGDTYVNIHTFQSFSGEIRAQIE